MAWHASTQAQQMHALPMQQMQPLWPDAVPWEAEDGGTIHAMHDF